MHKLLQMQSTCRDRIGSSNTSIGQAETPAFCLQFVSGSLVRHQRNWLDLQPPYVSLYKCCTYLYQVCCSCNVVNSSQMPKNWARRFTAKQELTTRKKDEISIRGMRSVAAGKKRDLTTIPGRGFPMRSQQKLIESDHAMV